MKTLAASGLGRLARPRAPLWDASLYLFLAVLFYLPLVLGLATFEAGDFADHFLPFSQFLQAELAAGRLPIWNPYTYAGHPFLADIQAGVYYLPAYPFLLAGAGAASAAGQLYWLQWEAVVHTALAGVGMHWLLGTLTGRRRAGAVAGLAFMLSGFITGYAPLQLAVLRSAVWLPFALAAVWQAVHRPRNLRSWLAATSFCALIILGGHAQTALYAAYTLVAWLIVALMDWRAVRRQATVADGARQWPALVGGLMGMGLGVAGLSAAQLLPSWEFLNLSVRANQDYAALSAGLPVRDTWQAILPGVFSQFSPLYIGVAALIPAGFTVCAALWGRLGAFYVLPDTGVLPNNTTSAAEASFHRGRRVTGFFALLALLGLLASYGDTGRLYPLLYTFAPGWDLFRGQERAAFLVALGLAGLAGLGAAWLPSAGRTLRKRCALIFGGIVTVAVYAFGLLYQLLGQTEVGNNLYLWLAFYTLGLGLIGCLLLWVDGWSKARSALLAFVIVANLFIANLGINLDWARPAFRVALPQEVSAIQDAVAETASIAPGRIYNEFRVLENYGMRAGLEDVWGASPLRLADYARLFSHFPLDRMWALTGVEYVLTWRRELFGPSELLAEFPQASDTTYLHRLPQVMPRAWLVESTVYADDEGAVIHLADHDVDLQAIAFLPTAGEHAANAGTMWTLGHVASRPVEPGRLLVEVDTPGPAFVVLSENWMPGRQVVAVECLDPQNAAVSCPAGADDGAGRDEIPIWTPLRVNLTLIGVATPGGRAQFELAYRPTSVRVGSLISGATLVVMVALALGAALRLRPRSGDGL